MTIGRAAQMADAINPHATKAKRSMPVSLAWNAPLFSQDVQVMRQPIPRARHGDFGVKGKILRGCREIFARVASTIA
jgi:hypothetical protein